MKCVVCGTLGKPGKCDGTNANTGKVGLKRIPGLPRLVTVFGTYLEPIEFLCTRCQRWAGSILNKEKP